MSKDKTFMIIIGFTFMVIILALQGIAVHHGRVLAATTSDINNNITDSKNIQNNLLITNILAKNLENHLQKAGAILEITSKLPQVRDINK
ncbi:MAG TPA: hypothetical protein VFJ05_07285 [Nitrososphaeraceae archaeon]|nr:hypothetical protein [Nitrososphaeraceae archaeon]